MSRSTTPVHSPLPPPRPVRAALFARGRRLLAAAVALAGGAALAQTADAPVVPAALSTLSIPAPSNLSDFVASKTSAIALGKALFWDLQVGSDGKTACASCHFAAGADPRSKNQLSQGPAGAGLAALQSKGINYQLKTGDFPFHRLSDPSRANSTVLRSLNHVSSSQGVFNDSLNNIVPGSPFDARTSVFDPVFNVAGTNVRRVEPRQSPSVINAVFYLRNFWDGRAQTIFNGVNPFGRRDESARVYKLVGTNKAAPLTPTAITLNDSSLASQASGPPLSGLEMSAAGRSFPELGRKMLSLRPLGLQQVASDDSVLGSHATPDGKGLRTYANYEALVKLAFKPEWWSGTASVTIDGRPYRQMEANFSLFFGLALQLYQATLVSDDAPFDKYRRGSSSALSSDQIQGLGLFMGKGKCINCHSGPVFSNAVIRRSPPTTERISSMIMGDGRTAVYDEGFYNIGVTRTTDDLGVGGNDPFGRPLAFSAIARQSASLFNQLEGEPPNISVAPDARIAVNGAFKTPTLRNVELTAPYFHDGSVATLRQVIELYNRGGNFASNNIADLDADIQPLGLTDAEIDKLVEFMRSLTDARVKLHSAPFDHPELPIPNGQLGNTTRVVPDAAGRATDAVLQLPPVGRSGYKSAAAVPAFLGIVEEKSGLQAQYFKTAVPAGTVAGQRIENAGLKVSLGLAPISGTSSSNWSVRQTGYLRAPAAGSYTLTVANRSDDGVRVWLNGALVVDNWSVPSRTSSTVSFSAETGDLLPLRIEAWDQGNSAQVSLSWTKPGGSAETIPVSALLPDEGLGLRAQYYKRADLGGPALASRVEMPSLDESVGTTPASGLLTSNWSVSWTGRLRAPVAGTYTLQVDNLVDDGVRLWVDGALAIDNWSVPAATSRTTTVTLQAGEMLPIRMDAWDADNAAKVSLKWKMPGASAFTTVWADYLLPH